MVTRSLETFPRGGCSRPWVLRRRRARAACGARLPAARPPRYALRKPPRPLQGPATLQGLRIEIPSAVPAERHFKPPLQGPSKGLPCAPLAAGGASRPRVGGVNAAAGDCGTAAAPPPHHHQPPLPRPGPGPTPPPESPGASRTCPDSDDSDGRRSLAGPAKSLGRLPVTAGGQKKNCRQRKPCSSRGAGPTLLERPFRISILSSAVGLFNSDRNS